MVYICAHFYWIYAKKWSCWVMSTCIFNFSRYWQFSKVVVPIYTPVAMFTSFVCFIFLPILYIINIFAMSCSGVCSDTLLRLNWVSLIMLSTFSYDWPFKYLLLWSVCLNFWPFLFGLFCSYCFADNSLNIVLVS